MSNYSKTTNFTVKDTLATGNSSKIVKGAELDVEFNAIQTAINTKVDQVSVASTKFLAGDGSGGIADSGVSISDVVLSSSNSVNSTGMVTMWTTGTAPSGWLLCDGSAVSRSTYSSLFAVVGTTYGSGDGSTTFNVPDFTGRVAIAAGTGNASDATAHALGDTGGTETHTLTESEMPAHTHSNSVASYADGSGVGTWPGGNSPFYGTHTWNTESTGGDTAHNNLQPYTVINFIIKT